MAEDREQPEARLNQGTGYLVTPGIPRRGGNYNNTSNAGLGYVNCNNSRSNANTNYGVRPDLPHRQIPQAHGPALSTG